MKSCNFSPEYRFISIVFFYFSAYFSLVFAFYQFMMVIFKEDWLEIALPKTHNTDIFSISLSTLIVLSLSMIMAMMPKKASTAFLSILYIVLIMPIIILYSYDGLSIYFMITSIASFLVVLLVVALPTIIRVNISSFECMTPNFIIIISIISSTIFIASTFYFGGGEYLNFNFDRVYEFRRAAFANIPTALGYLFENTISSLIGVSTAFAIWKRKYVVFFVNVIVVLISFALFSNKGHFFVIIMVVIAYYIFSKKNVVVFLALGTVMLSILSVTLINSNKDWSRFGTYTIRRLYIAPAYLHYFYYDFFTENEKMVWSDSKVSLGLVENPYERPAPQVIMSEYNPKDWSKTVVKYANANTGWLGAGYAHLGYFGLLIYAVIIGTLIRIVDVLAKKTTKSVAGGALIYAYLSLFNSSDIPSMFFSHGILILLMITLFLKTNQCNSKGYECY